MPVKILRAGICGKASNWVLESGSEIRCIIEDTKGGLCCEPGEYDKVEENIRWFIDNAGSEELKPWEPEAVKTLKKI